MFKKIGIIGLGAMGGAIAKRLHGGGHSLAVYDINDELAARFRSKASVDVVESPAELARRSDLILVSLPGTNEVRQVALGANGVIEGIQADSVFVNMSTCAPTVVVEIESAFASRGAGVIGAPINGGPSKAMTGELAIVAGGEGSLLERCRSVLEQLGTVRHVGRTGSGEAVKIINNLLLGIIVPATAEALVLGVKAGIEPSTLVDAIENGVGDSHALRKHYKQHVLKGDFGEEGLFSVDYMRKDLKLAMEMADELKVPLVFGGVADQVYQMARAKGSEANYHPVIVTILEELVGVKVREKRPD
ncbi:MAG: NAD(P)-dependent oxidoreductase [Pseudomonadota bacterium]